MGAQAVGQACGANPIPVDISSSQFPDSPYSWINSIAVDRTDADHMLVCFSNYESPSIFFSHNGGMSWNNISANLEEFPDGSGSGPSVRWVEILNYQGQRYYFAGTSVGLFVTTLMRGPFTVWEHTGAQTIGWVPVDMIESRDQDGLVVVATHGNGVYSTHVESMKETSSEIDIPATSSLRLSSWPNPFENEVTISFELQRPANTTLDVFDVSGRLIARIIDKEVLDAGVHAIPWFPQELTPGRYFFRLQRDGQVGTTVGVLAN